jgi:hypothetical protein
LPDAACTPVDNIPTLVNNAAPPASRKNARRWVAPLSKSPQHTGLYFD